MLTVYVYPIPAAPMKLAVGFIVALSLERKKLYLALRTLLAFWDRRDESGWTAADVQRLAEIRNLVTAQTGGNDNERATE
jgi:hypothetical protein